MRLPSTEEKAHNICIFLSASFNIVFSFKYQKASTRVDSTKEELESSGLLVMAKEQQCWSSISARGLSFAFDTSLRHDSCCIFKHPFRIQGRKKGKATKVLTDSFVRFYKNNTCFPRNPNPHPSRLLPRTSWPKPGHMATFLQGNTAKSGFRVGILV